MSLRWSDISWKENRIRVNKRWRKGRDGKPKTAASDSTVALGSILAYHLRAWRKASAYTTDNDFVFPSRTKNGSVPICASVFDRSAEGCYRGWRKNPRWTPLRTSQSAPQPQQLAGESGKGRSENRAGNASALRCKRRSTCTREATTTTKSVRRIGSVD